MCRTPCALARGVTGAVPAFKERPFAGGTEPRMSSGVQTPVQTSALKRCRIAGRFDSCQAHLPLRPRHPTGSGLGRCAVAAVDRRAQILQEALAIVAELLGHEFARERLRAARGGGSVLLRSSFQSPPPCGSCGKPNL